MSAFEDAWKRKFEAIGYRYGKAELESVELGWRMAIEAAIELANIEQETHQKTFAKATDDRAQDRCAARANAARNIADRLRALAL